MYVCVSKTHNNKYTLRSTPLASQNKPIFLFECPMATRTIFSSLETSNVIISN